MLSIYFLAVVSVLSPTVTRSAGDFTELVNSAPVVAVGKITEIGEPPITWSTGDFMFAQKVKYKVTRVLKGEKVSDEITVYHYLFKGSPNADKDRPNLSPALFTIGSEHILFIRSVQPVGGRDHSSGVTMTDFAELTSARRAVPASENNLRRAADRAHNSPPCVASSFSRAGVHRTA